MANLKDLLVSGAAKLLSTLRVSGDTHIDGTLYLNGPIGSASRMVYVDNSGKFVAGKDLSAVTNFDSSNAIEKIVRTANATTYTLTTVAGATSTLATPVAAGTAGRIAYYTDAYNVGQSTISWASDTLTVPGSIVPSTNNARALGTTSLRWSKLYLGSANSYGGAYLPIWWNNGLPQAVTDNKMIVNLGAHTAGESDTYASSVWREKPRPGVYGILPVAGGGTGSNNKRGSGLIYDWTAVIQGQTWSRLCYVPTSTSVTGTSVFLNIRATRGSVVYNYTVLIHPHHPSTCEIVVLQGSNYSAIKLRGEVDSSGNLYIEIYDDANSIANTTTQNVSCHMWILTKGETEPTLYTAFTDGTTVVSGFTANEILLVNSGGIQTNRSIHIHNDTDISGTAADATAPFTIGTLSSTHLTFDNNEIIAKNSATGSGTLNLQTDGGYTYIGSKVGILGTNTGYGLYVNGTEYVNGTLTVNNRTQSPYVNSTQMSTRHLDAGLNAVNADHNLYIGYGGETFTRNTYFYYSTGTDGTNTTTSRTLFFTVNSNGAYASTRFGVNGQNTSYNLYVNGTTWMTNYLRIGNGDAAKTDTATNNGFGVPNVGTHNYIAFYGVNGDGPGSFNHTYIGERIYQSPTLTSGELSELLIFHGNETGAVNNQVNYSGTSVTGPDRIRMLSHQFQVDVTISELNGTWETVGQATNREPAFVVNQTSGIFLGNDVQKVNGVNLTTIYGHVMIDADKNSSNGFNEGLRINRGSNGWSTIALGGNAGTYTGTGERVWSISTYSANTTSGTVSDFYLRRNGGSGTTAPGINGGTNGFSVWNRLFVNQTQNTSYHFAVTGASQFYNGLVRIDRDCTQATVDARNDEGTAQIQLRVKTTDATDAPRGYSIIKAMQTPTPTTYNQSMVIYSTGGMFIGGGESADTIWRNNDTGSGTENLYLCADSDILFYPAADGKVLYARMNSTELRPEANNRLNLGAAAQAWKFVFSNGIAVNRDGSNSAGGISLYSVDSQITSYGIAMRAGSAHGWITAAQSNEDIARAQGIATSDATGVDWAIRFYNSGSKLRGFQWLHGGSIIASLNGYGYMQVNRLGLNRVNGNANGRIYWYNPSWYVWIDYMSNPGDGLAPHGGRPSVLGSVTDWAIRSLVNNATSCGWIWESAPNAIAAAATTPTPLMALNSNDGTLFLNGDMIISSTSGEQDRSLIFGYQNNTTQTQNIGASWRIVHKASGSGNTNYFAIETTGSTTGNNIAWVNTLRIGMNQHEGTFNGHWLPQTTAVFDLGAPSQRWNNLYLQGNLVMQDVGTPSAYAYISNKITWTGGTDAAELYYQIDSADAGRLMINTKDDANCLVAMAYNGTAKAYFANSTPSFYPAANGTGSLGLSDYRWNELYVNNVVINGSNAYGAYGYPVYWSGGKPVATYPCQYTTWTIASGGTSVTLTKNNQYFADTYVIALIVTSGESYLNGPITWTSAANTLTLTTSAATSGAVSGYVITARAHAI